MSIKTALLIVAGLIAAVSILCVLLVWGKRKKATREALTTADYIERQKQGKQVQVSWAGPIEQEGEARRPSIPHVPYRPPIRPAIQRKRFPDPGPEAIDYCTSS